MKCIIIASGNLDYSKKTVQLIQSSDCIICADGGASHLKRLDILPDIILGDADSIEKNDLDYYKKKGVEIIAFSPRKDHTDSDLCVRWAIENKASDITLLGVTGTRLDHTLANIFLLKKLAKKNIAARIIDANNEIYLCINHLQLRGEPGELLSILPLTSEVEGVTLKGLEYPLKNARIQMGSSLGISNIFKESSVWIRISKGMLMVTKSKD